MWNSARSVLLALLLAGGCGGEETEPAEGPAAAPQDNAPPSAPAKAPPVAEPVAPAAPDHPPGTAPAPGAGNEHAAPSIAKLMPVAVGQWARYRMTEGRGRNRAGTLLWEVVGEQDGAFWYEMEFATEGEDASLFKVLVDHDDRSMREAVLRIGGRTMRFDGALLQAQSRMLRGWTAMLDATMESAEREDVTVPAGTYRQCYKRNETVELGGRSIASTVWRHPDVPVLGTVRVQGEEGFTMELLESATTGARATLE